MFCCGLDSEWFGFEIVSVIFLIRFSSYILVLRSTILMLTGVVTVRNCFQLSLENDFSYGLAFLWIQRVGDTCVRACGGASTPLESSSKSKSKSVKKSSSSTSD